MATINSAEISEIIKSKIESYGNPLEVNNVGQVLEVGDGIVRIYGLNNVMSSELIEFEDGSEMEFERSNLAIIRQTVYF